MSTIHILIKALVALCCVQGCTIPAATVQGSVVNGDGKHLAGALVEVVNPYQAEGGVLNYIKTDKAGYFKKDGLAPGEYMVFASKEDQGYGDTRSAMFSVGLTVPEVKIRESDEVVDVEVNLGSPGGFLKGVVIDEQTGDPVTPAKVRIALEAQPDKFMFFAAGEQGFEALAPSLPIIISAGAPGYQSWATALTLSPGEHKTLTIRLRKSAGS